MDDIIRHQHKISNDGYTIVEDIYTDAEVKNIITAIEAADKNGPSFRQTEDVFAIRQFLKEVPTVVPLVFNNTLKLAIHNLFGEGYFVVKSIYFDKPASSNWFVAWHQDLTVSVNKKIDIEGYGPWTVKHNQFGVQPPLNILQGNFTIRIHLDETDEGNGTLKVIPGSHLKEVCRAETIDWQRETETACNVKAGGMMVMRPLLMHASSRTTNGRQRRVVHIEFSRSTLVRGIEWAERMGV